MDRHTLARHRTAADMLRAEKGAAVTRSGRAMPVEPPVTGEPFLRGVADEKARQRSETGRANNRDGSGVESRAVAALRDSGCAVIEISPKTRPAGKDGKGRPLHVMVSDGAPDVALCTPEGSLAILDIKSTASGRWSPSTAPKSQLLSMEPFRTACLCGFLVLLNRGDPAREVWRFRPVVFRDGRPVAGDWAEGFELTNVQLATDGGAALDRLAKTHTTGAD